MIELVCTYYTPQSYMEWGESRFVALIRRGVVTLRAECIRVSTMTVVVVVSPFPAGLAYQIVLPEKAVER
jgi:hypothetical protein